MLVRALEACFIAGHRRRKDAEFEYAGEILPPHLVPVKANIAPAATVKPSPVALSEMAGDVTPKSFVEAVNRRK